MDPIQLKDWLSRLSIIERREGEKQLFVRVHGSQTVEDLGQDFSRQYIEDVTEGIAQDIATRPYKACVEAMKPVFSTVEATPGSTVFTTLDRLVLPFTDIDPQTPDAPATIDRFICWLGPTDRVPGEDSAVYRAELPFEGAWKKTASKGSIQIMVIDVDDKRYGLDDPSQPIMPFAAQRPLAKQP